MVNKGFKFGIVFLMLLIVSSFAFGNPWDIASATLISGMELDYTSESSNMVDFYMSPDGLYFFALDNGGDDIYRYELSVPWNLSTATYNGNILITTEGESNPWGIYFTDDGKNIYIAGSTLNSVKRYELSVPWNLSTATYTDSKLINEMTSPVLKDISFSKDGTIMVISEINSDRLYKYTCASPYKPSSCSYSAGDYYTIASNNNNFIFNNEGTKVYSIKNVQYINEYDISSPYDISPTTLSLVQFFDTAPTGTVYYGFFIDNQGRYLFSNDGINNNVDVFSMESSSFDIFSQIYNENYIQNFSITINGTQYNTTTGYINTSLDRASLYNITFESEYFNKNYTNWNSNNDLIIDFAVSKVTLTDKSTDLNVVSFNVDVNSTLLNIDIQYSTTDGVIEFYSPEGDITFLSDNENYTIVEDTYTINDGINEINLEVYTTNSINITISNELTNNLINDRTVNIEFISEIASYNFSTLTGYKYVDLIAPGQYTIRYFSENYTTRYYYFELTNRTFNELNLYLLEDIQTDLVTITIIDQEANSLEGALVKSLKYDITTNSYLLQQSILTNNDGQAIFSIVLGEEFHYFIVEYPAGTQLKQTSPSLIYSDTVLIQVQTEAPGGTSWQNTLGINHNITWYNDTNEFTFRYNDGEGTVSEGCFYIYDSKYNGKTLLNSTCASGAANTLTLGVDGAEGSYYIAKAYVKINGGYTLIEELQQVIPLAGIFNYTSLFFVAMLLLAFAMTAIKTGPAAVVLLPMIGLMGVKLMGLLSGYVTWGTVFSLSIVAIIIAVLLKRRTGI